MRRGTGARFAAGCLAVAMWLVLPVAPATAAVLQAHIGMSFGAVSIQKGGNTTLSFSVSNPNPSGGLTNVGFSDSLPSGLMFNVAGTNDCGGTLTQTATSLTLSGASLGAGQLCVVSNFEVIGTTAGTKTNSVTVTSSAGTGNTATAMLTVVAPPEPSTLFTDATGGGSPDWITLGASAGVNIAVTNPNTDASLTGVGLTDSLPAGLVVANPNGLLTGGACGPNTVTAVPGSHTITLSGVSLAAGASDPNSVCALVVAVTGTQNGIQTNTTGIVSSNEGGGAAPVTASIGVFGPGPRIYWGATLSGAASGLVQFARLNGTVAGTLANNDGSGGVEGTAIDAAAGRIYWIDAANARISWSSLDDSTSGSVSASGATLTGPEGMAIDPAAGLIYWANTGGVHPISYAHLDGTGGGNLNTAGASAGVGAGPAIDIAQHRIYWANPSGNKISYANLDGSGGGGDLATAGATVSGPTGVTVDEAAGRIYWANENAAKISYANLDGSGGADLDTTGAQVLAPVGVAVDPTTGRVYWANQTSVGSISYAVPGGAAGTLATPGLTPTAPAFPSLLYPPQPAGTATVAGAGHPGATLTCSAGWAADLLGAFLYRAPQTVAYQWQRNGVAVSGATSRTYIPQNTGSYTCVVTATNAAGSTVESSSPHPIATLSAVKITSPAKLFQLGSKITVSYSASDSAGPAAVTYDVQYERATWNGGFGGWTTLATGTSATAKSMTGALGSEYCFRVRAHDTAGNSSGWAVRCTVLPLDDRALAEVTGGWSRISASGAYRGTLTTTSRQGAKLRLRGAEVDRVALVVTECPGCGKVGIYLGGTLWTTVNTYASTTRNKVIVVTGPFALRSTTVVLRAMNSGKKVLVDALGIARI